MEVEVQSVAKEHKTKLQIKLRSYKSDLARYKADVVGLTDLLKARSTEVGWFSDIVYDGWNGSRNHYAPQATETTYSAMAGIEPIHLQVEI